MKPDARKKSPYRLFERLLRGMCHYDEDCEYACDDMGADVEIRVSPHAADFPVIVGKRGRQIKAIKYLAQVAGQRCGQCVSLTLDESYKGEPEQHKPFQQDPEFDDEQFLKFFNDWLDLLFCQRPSYTCERSCDRLAIRVRISNQQDAPVVAALGDAFYPYGFKAGCLLDIKTTKV